MMQPRNYKSFSLRGVAVERATLKVVLLYPFSMLKRTKCGLKYY